MKQGQSSFLLLLGYSKQIGRSSGNGNKIEYDLKDGAIAENPGQDPTSTSGKLTCIC